MDGVGLAIQPLLGTYLGEDNNVMIKRVMNEAKNAACCRVVNVRKNRDVFRTF